jgi:hypothetical protein
MCLGIAESKVIVLGYDQINLIDIEQVVDMRPLFHSLSFVFCVFAMLTSLPLRAQNVVATLSAVGTGHGPKSSGSTRRVRRWSEYRHRCGEDCRDERFGTVSLQRDGNRQLSITVTQKGFREARGLVQVQVANTTLQNFELQVGAIGEAVTVTDTVPLLRPTDSSVSTLIDRSFFDELPLNGRKYTNFTLLSPNTPTDGDTGLVSIAGQQGGEDSGYANGNGATSFTVDGTNTTSNYFGDILGRYRIPYLYGENGVQEFQVAVSPYSSIYGGGQGFINTVTRSGTNAFHGEAFYYNRNSAFEANDALSNANGLPKPYDNLQQFGGGIGGPILRDRLWS